MAKFKITDTPGVDKTDRVGDEVDLKIMHRTPLGYVVQVDGNGEGLIYHNEIFEPIVEGEFKRGYIKQVRDDGKIDITLQKPGYDNILQHKQTLIDLLERNNGVLRLGDKSAPNQIMATLHISKKTFKKLLGALYKERKIIVHDYKIELIEK